MFIPAFNNGNAPYGTWRAAFVATNTDWFNSGTTPNGHDFGMLEAIDDPNVGTIGSVVGYLGWQTLGLSDNHFSMLGYPGNLDGGMLMQRNDAQTFRFNGNNTWIQATDMGAGSSGGPWVQDFGVQPAGAPPAPGGGNLVVGVTSYGPIEYSGASQFDGTFTALRAFMCARRVGNC
jgi:hypothetical protein